MSYGRLSLQPRCLWPPAERRPDPRPALLRRLFSRSEACRVLAVVSVARLDDFAG